MLFRLVIALCGLLGVVAVHEIKTEDEGWPMRGSHRRLVQARQISGALDEDSQERHWLADSSVYERSSADARRNQR